MKERAQQTLFHEITFIKAPLLFYQNQNCTKATSTSGNTSVCNIEIQHLGVIQFVLPVDPPLSPDHFDLTALSPLTYPAALSKRAAHKNAPPERWSVPCDVDGGVSSTSCPRPFGQAGGGGGGGGSREPARRDSQR